MQIKNSNENFLSICFVIFVFILIRTKENVDFNFVYVLSGIAKHLDCIYE